MVEYTYDPFIVPTEPAENAAWREKTLRLAAASPAFQQDIVAHCAADFWYWSRGFAFVHEPRILDDSSEVLETRVNFLPWPHQIPVVDRILAVLGKRDLRIIKSRAQGASWLIVLIFLWCWLFMRGFKGNLVSKDEKAVDQRADMNSLMAKFDWLIKQLPVWMVGERTKAWNRSYSDHTLSRADGETAIAGFACTADVGSGGRATAFVLDEHAKHPRGPDKQALAATQPITRCRIFISTPKGMDGAFYEIVHDTTIEEPLLVLDWKANPTQNRGLYRLVRGSPVAVDESQYGPLPKEYRDKKAWGKLKTRLLERGYDLTTGKLRSPWYDEECLRSGADPILIAQEYDMDFGSSVARYFSEALVNRLQKQTVRLYLRGEFSVCPETLTGTWSDNEDGRFRLWCALGSGKQPPPGEYIVACDVAGGVGGSQSSNSTISVVNRRMGKKVAAFASPAVLPYELAEMAIAVARWFANFDGRPAFLIWEVNGYGNEFKQRVERSDFQFYYRRKARDANLKARDTQYGGYHTQRRSALLGPYREALLEGFFNDPDPDSVDELRQYEMGMDGEPVHCAEKTRDASGAKAAHGDRTTSNALAWIASLTFGDQQASHRPDGGGNLNVNNVRENLVPAGSAAWRRARYLDLMRKKGNESKW